MRASVLAIILATGCVNTVVQTPSRHPRPIDLESNVGQASGRVTGNTWRSIETPEGKRGSLDIFLGWQPPGPGVDVAFDVLDQWYQPIVANITVHARDSQQRVRPGVTIDDASGRYYVRVYSPADVHEAGTYQVTVRFREAAPAAPAAASSPAPAVAPSDPAARPPVADSAPRPAPPARPARRPAPPPAPAPVAVAPAPAPVAPPVPVPVPVPVPPAAKPAPIFSRVIEVSIVGDAVHATVGIPKGTEVTHDWKAYVLRDDSNERLPGGDATILRIANTYIVLRTSLTLDEINANPRIQLVPP